MTTRCVVAELGLLGEELRGAMYIAKRFQQRRCSHGKEKLTAAECILSLTGTLGWVSVGNHFQLANSLPTVAILLPLLV